MIALRALASIVLLVAAVAAAPRSRRCNAGALAHLCNITIHVATSDGYSLTYNAASSGGQDLEGAHNVVYLGFFGNHYVNLISRDSFMANHVPAPGMSLDEAWQGLVHACHQQEDLLQRLRGYDLSPETVLEAARLERALLQRFDESCARRSRSGATTACDPARAMAGRGAGGGAPDAGGPGNQVLFGTPTPGTPHSSRIEEYDVLQLASYLQDMDKKTILGADGDGL
jgi:hypothetical protein